RDPRLAKRAFAQHRPLVCGHQPGQPDLLDRDLTVEPQVARPPYRSHGAVPDRIQQLIASSDHASRTGHWLHRREITPNRRAFFLGPGKKLPRFTPKVPPTPPPAPPIPPKAKNPPGFAPGTWGV